METPNTTQGARPNDEAGEQPPAGSPAAHELPRPNAAPRPPRLSRGWLWAGIVLMLLGLAHLGSLDVRERQQRASIPWERGLVVVGEESPWPDAQRGFRLPVRAEDAKESPLLSQLRAQPGGAEVVRQFGLDDHGHVLALEVSQEEWPKLVAGGRAPTPGAFEVLAGDLCELEAVTVGSQRFEVVGRARPGIGMLTMTYLAPMESFEAAAAEGPIEAETVWFERDARGGLAEAIESGEGPEALADFEGLELHTFRPLTSPSTAQLAVYGLGMIAFGGVLAWTWLFRALGAWMPTWAGSVFAEVGRAPLLYASVHVLLYGAFFGSMLVAVERPELGYRLAVFVEHQFRDGGLSFIGEAYESGSIPSAMATTWLWNYGMATVVMSILPSVIVPFWGVAKNLLSFSVIGLALAPIWAGTVQGMIYHSGTMVLELQAYVLVAFFVSRYVALLAKGIWRGPLVPHARRAFALIVSGTVAVGVMLGIAALYEAVTLILFHFA